MSTLRLETYIRTDKPKSKAGHFWDRLTKASGEPPYRQLPEYHIRVLKLKPGTARYPLRVKLKVIDPRKTDYTALSYTWDIHSNTQPNGLQIEPEPFRTVLCGGTPVRITRNLFDALCQLRDVQSDKAAPIFVDALCINFSDSQERIEVMKIMGHVYSRASSVIIWLGKKEIFSDETIVIMRKLVNAIDWRKINDQSSYNFRDPNFFTRIGMDPLTIQQWRSIHHFCNLKWFTRYWAFFEIVLAKKVVFLHGETCMDYEFLLDFGMILGLSSWLEELPQVSNDTTQDSAIALTSMLGPVSRLRTIPPWHPKSPQNEQWMREHYGLRSEDERAWKFFEILLQSAEALECRDPLDRVYAPLALIRTIYAGERINKLWPLPRYDQNVGEVYANFSNLILQHTGEPSILSTTGIPTHTTQVQEQHRGRSTRARIPLD